MGEALKPGHAVESLLRRLTNTGAWASSRGLNEHIEVLPHSGQQSPRAPSLFSERDIFFLKVVRREGRREIGRTERDNIGEEKRITPDTMGVLQIINLGPIQ